MRRYETVFILRPNLGEKQIKDAIRRFEGIIASGGGELIETDEWGSRELAYNIAGERRGYYVRLDYGAAAAVTNEVERNLKLADSVLRYLSVMVEPEADALALRKEVEARRRRLAEARTPLPAPAESGAAEQAAPAPEQASTPGAVPAPASEPAQAPAPEAKEPSSTETEGGAEQD